MTPKASPAIVIRGARTNNLKNVSLRIPHNKFIVVTGISGSGKSSLVFEIITKEGQRRYFETLPSFARQFMGKLNRPEVDEIEGLSPVIAIGQHTTGMHARSTVGTMSDLYDLLRLLFARTGTTKKEIVLSRALFSFNAEVGKCKLCNGIGKQEQIDLNRLIAFPEKTIREGALAPTLPNGYIMYSQVTIEVLNQVCEAEGFHVDIPWQELTDRQREVVLYGSDKIKVPFGKHSLESRLKWTGIKAKPREEGHYKGMIPIMSDILRRDRNANILKYVHAVTCPACQGARLNEDALSVTVQGKSIAEVVKLELNELKSWVQSNTWGVVAREIIAKLEAQLDLLEDLGLGHLTVDRSAKSLRASEIQRIRVANQILVPLSDVLYVFDEPSIGLHREENERLIHHFKELVKKGNTVIVVEHDLDTITSADHIIEMGPQAGANGGEVLFNGAFSDFARREGLEEASPTYRAIKNSHAAAQRRGGKEEKERKDDIHAEEQRRGEKEEKGRKDDTHAEAQRRGEKEKKGRKDDTHAEAQRRGEKEEKERKDDTHAEAQRRGEKEEKERKDDIHAAAQRRGEKEEKERKDDTHAEAQRRGEKEEKERKDDIHVEAQRRRGLIVSDLQSPKITLEIKGLKGKVGSSPKTTSSSIRLIGCGERNLKNITVEFQLGQLNVVSGRSGAGKSSLVKGILLKAVRQQLGLAELSGLEPAQLTSHEHLDAINKLIFIDHSPIGKTPRSNPATYLGLSDHIRDLYASLPESKTQGFTKSRFSFNNKGGRCETCQGAGKTQIGMHFLGNVDLVCGSCNGDRFNEETLQVKYRGLSIADVYKLSINEAVAFFGDQEKADSTNKEKQRATEAPRHGVFLDDSPIKSPSLNDATASKNQSENDESPGSTRRSPEANKEANSRKKVLAGLKILQEIGLGYLTLGQSSTTLSGGEAQRIKIANQLQKKDTGDTLYVIIEPSIGLHHDDLTSLLQLFGRIKQQGNTIVCIEQNEAVIAWSDWHLELGPKSGKEGGEVVYQGIPRATHAEEGFYRAETQRRREKRDEEEKGTENRDSYAEEGFYRAETQRRREKREEDEIGSENKDAHAEEDFYRAETQRRREKRDEEEKGSENRDAHAEEGFYRAETQRRREKRGEDEIGSENRDAHAAEDSYRAETQRRREGGPFLSRRDAKTQRKEEGVRSTNKAHSDTTEETQETWVSKEILLNGVTTHGLKNIDVRIPKNQLTVVTGVSGSGKSSLVYDTLFAEANARFTESLSTYHRSFLQQNSAAEIAAVAGLGPAIGINRKGGTPSQRSTVGTLSGVYDAFRLLYSRIAQQQGASYTAQHFSFNHHLGACPACAGLGVQRKCDPDKVIVARDKSIQESALAINKALAYYADVNGQFMATLREVAKQKGWNIERPWQHLEEEIREVILYGTGDTTWEVTWAFNTKSRKGTQDLTAKWLGFCHYIDEEYQRKRHNKNIKELEALLHDVVCPACHGSRLKPELLSTTFLGKNIHELSQMSIASSLDLLSRTDHQVDAVVLAISKVVLPAVIASLQTIVELGLGYLNLDRAVSTLSGGERQRVTLAGQLSTHLFGVCYVLDEPTIGLDEAQVAVLTKVLKSIVANGNTVVVVEHDPSFIRSADYLIEMGPGAGRQGGEVIYQGKVSGIVKVKHSVTYQLLQAQRVAPVKQHRKKGDSFGVKGAFANNLKHIDVAFYARQLIAITGVSGSGKSSLVKEVLHRSWLQQRPVNCTSVNRLDQFAAVLLIDQRALPQSSTSTLVSYTGILEDLKTVFSKTASAKTAGLKKADFSYHSKKGKCTTCAGHGKLKTSMDFMSDLWLSCDTCRGLRYNDTVLTCTFQGRSIGEVLRMTVQEAIAFFGTGPLVKKLETLQRVGVGHLLLGQAGNTLSGGEAQRLKLATSMLQERKGATLYLFDEPSTGLHYFDILRLINVFQSLVERGDTVLFIEHNSTLIAAADQVITLGPGSGENGGVMMKG